MLFDMEFIYLHSIVTQLIIFGKFNFKIGLIFLRLSHVELKLTLKYTQFAVLGSKVPVKKGSLADL